MFMSPFLPLDRSVWNGVRACQRCTFKQSWRLAGSWNFAFPDGSNQPLTFLVSLCFRGSSWQLATKRPSPLPLPQPGSTVPSIAHVAGAEGHLARLAAMWGPHHFTRFWYLKILNRLEHVFWEGAEQSWETSPLDRFRSPDPLARRKRGSAGFLWPFRCWCKVSAGGSWQLILRGRSHLHRWGPVSCRYMHHAVEWSPQKLPRATNISFPTPTPALPPTKSVSCKNDPTEQALRVFCPITASRIDWSCCPTDANRSEAPRNSESARSRHLGSMQPKGYCSAHVFNGNFRILKFMFRKWPLMFVFESSQVSSAMPEVAELYAQICQPASAPANITKIWQSLNIFIHPISPTFQGSIPGTHPRGLLWSLRHLRRAAEWVPPWTASRPPRWRRWSAPAWQRR